MKYIKSYFIHKEFEVKKGLTDSGKIYWCVFRNGVDVGHEKTLKIAKIVCINWDN